MKKVLLSMAASLLLVACSGADMQKMKDFTFNSITMPAKEKETMEKNLFTNVVNALQTQQRMAKVITQESFAEELFRKRALDFLVFPRDNMSFLSRLEFLSQELQKDLKLEKAQQFTATIIEETDKSTAEKKAYRIKAVNDYFSVYFYIFKNGTKLEKNPASPFEVLIFKEGKGKNRELLKEYSEDEFFLWTKNPQVLKEILEKANPKLKK